MEQGTFDKLKAIGTLAVFLFFAYLIFTNSALVKEFAQGYGLLGLFIASVIANATVLLPMPIDLIVLAISIESSTLPEVIIVAGVVGIGAAIGELTAYMAGLLGVRTAEKLKEKEFEQIRIAREKIEKLGMRFIFLMALLPLPFDIIGITAGFIKYNPQRFFAAALGGKVLRFILLGIGGFYGIEYLRAVGF